MVKIGGVSGERPCTGLFHDVSGYLQYSGGNNSFFKRLILSTHGVNEHQRLSGYIISSDPVGSLRECIYPFSYNHRQRRGYILSNQLREIKENHQNKNHLIDRIAIGEHSRHKPNHVSIICKQINKANLTKSDSNSSPNSTMQYKKKNTTKNS